MAAREAVAASVGLSAEAGGYQIATLARAQVPAAFHALLRVVFFSRRADRFLSVTVTETDVTLIAAPEELAPLEEFGLRQDGTTWRVVRVGEGAMGFEKVGVIERITGPLAAASIPVLYVSTFSSDYVLVPSNLLDDALQQFDSRHEAAPNHAFLESELRQHSHPLNVLQAHTRVLQIERRHRQSHTQALIRLLFMPEEDDPPQLIASLTETPDEISIIAGDLALPRCVPIMLALGDIVVRLQASLHGGPSIATPWRTFMMIRSFGFRFEWVTLEALRLKRSGLLPRKRASAALRSPAWIDHVCHHQPPLASRNVLAKAQVTILYLSTYFSDYTLIQAEAVETAVQAFKEHGFSVSLKGLNEEELDKKGVTYVEST